MDCVYPHNYVTAATLDNPDSDFPAENVRQGNLGRPAKSLSNEDTLTLSVQSGAEVVTIHGTNALELTVTVETGGGLLVPLNVNLINLEPDYYTPPAPQTSYYQRDGYGVGQLWGAYVNPGLGHFIKITGTSATGTQLYFGVAKAGPRLVWPDPYDIEINPLYTGTVTPLYYPGAEKDAGDGQVIKSYRLQFRTMLSPDFYQFLEQVVVPNKLQAMPWRLRSDGGSDWVKYVKFSADRLPSFRVMSKRSINTLEFIDEV